MCWRVDSVAIVDQSCGGVMHESLVSEVAEGDWGAEVEDWQKVPTVELCGTQLWICQQGVVYFLRFQLL